MWIFEWPLGWFRSRIPPQPADTPGKCFKLEPKVPHYKVEGLKVHFKTTDLKPHFRDSK